MTVYHKNLRSRLESLADYVEAHGQGALRGANELIPFSQAQAETYVRFYEGYKREVQAQSIESCLIEPDDPLFGWGWLAQHEPLVYLIGASSQAPILYQGRDFQEEALKQKRRQSAELHVIKRPTVIATMPMYILHATIAPTLIPNAQKGTVVARIARVQKQVKYPGLYEKIGKLCCIPTIEGIEVRMTEGVLYKIGSISK